MRLQTSSAGLAIGDADNRYLRLAGGTMTGELSALAGLNTTRPYSSGLVPQDSSDPLPAFPFVTEWNNAGKNWTAARVNVTNTASGSGSKIADFQANGATVAAVTKTGTILSSGLFFGTSGTTDFSISPLGSGAALAVLSGNFGAINRPLTAQKLWASDEIAVGGSGFLGFYSNGGNPAQTGSLDTGLQRDAAGVVKFTDGSGSLRDWKARRGSLSEYLDITEMSAPAAPAANTARLYVEDNGSGKTRLMVLFPTGAAQVLATEP